MSNTVLCGNDGSPFEGIDTFWLPLLFLANSKVEMMVACVRALTHTIFSTSCFFNSCGNELPDEYSENQNQNIQKA